MSNTPLLMNPNPLAAANMVNQLFNAGDPDQYKRELVYNAIDAGATDIEAGAIRLAEYGEDGGIKAAFIDNGRGMSATKLADYIGELFNGASEIDSQGNYNMGGRVATLPFNPLGVIWASWVEGDEEGAFIHIAHNEEKRVYEIVSQYDNTNVVADDDRIGVPLPEWKHPMIHKAGHGTVVILLGTTIEDNTVGVIERQDDGTFIYPNTRRPREDWQYYNTKFWKLPEEVKRLAFMWAEQKLENWKKHITPGEFFRPDDEHRVRRFRTWKGLAGLLEENAENTGSQIVTSARGYKARVHWGLFPENYLQKRDGTSTATDEAVPLGLFAEKHRDELYALAYRSEGTAGSRGHVSFKLEMYGVAHAEVKNRLVIVVEPLSNQDYMPAAPAPSRHELRLANSALPHKEWGEEFAQQMPAAIKARIDSVTGKTDEDLEKKLRDDQKKLSSFFARLIASRSEKRAKPGPVGDADADQAGTSGGDPESGGTPGESDERSPGLPNGKRSSTPRPQGKGPRVGGGVKKRLDAPSVPHSNFSQPVQVLWDNDGTQFEGNDEGLLARWIETSRMIWINGVHPHVVQLVNDAVSTRRASGEQEAIERVQSAIKAHLARHVLSIELYGRTAAAGGRGRSGSFKRNALSDDALSAVLLNVLGMETIIGNTFRGSRTTTKVKTSV